MNATAKKSTRRPQQGQSSNDKKAQFIRALAQFTSNNQAGKSIALQMEVQTPPSPLRPRFASEWADVRMAARLRGYETMEEAIEHLTELLR